MQKMYKILPFSMYSSSKVDWWFVQVQIIKIQEAFSRSMNNEKAVNDHVRFYVVYKNFNEKWNYLTCTRDKRIDKFSATGQTKCKHCHFGLWLLWNWNCSYDGCVYFHYFTFSMAFWTEDEVSMVRCTVRLSLITMWTPNKNKWPPQKILFFIMFVCVCVRSFLGCCIHTITLNEW